MPLRPTGEKVCSFFHFRLGSVQCQADIVGPRINPDEPATVAQTGNGGGAATQKWIKHERSKYSNRAIHKDLQDKRKVACGLEP
jgi:hypothetical protein